MSHFNAVTVFCDDIRTEDTGADMLIGLYPDRIEVASFPVALSKIGIYTRINIPFDAPVEAITVVLSIGSHEQTLSDMTVEFLARLKEEAFKAGAPFVGVTSKTTLSPLILNGSQSLLAHVKTATETILCGYLKVVGATSPTASQPPSGQSPPAAPAS